MKRILLAAAGVLATIPGLGSLTGHLPTPPGQRFLFGAVAEILGVAAIMLLWLWRRQVEALRLRNATRIAIALAVLFMVCFSVNAWLFQLTIVAEAGRTSVFLPLWPGEDLAYMIDSAGSRHGALVSYGADSLIDAAQKTPLSAAITTLVVLLAHQATLVIPVLLCCGLALRAKKMGTP